MRIIFVAVIAVFLSSFAFAQTNGLPDILKPDQVAESNAKAMQAGIFKILPRGMFKAEDASYKDEDNPIGIREGGAYYSFATRSHSYNKIPQIGFETGKISVGFYGASYGFMIDAGSIPLSEVTLESDLSKFIAGYKPPKFINEIRAEQTKSNNYEANGHVYTRIMPAEAAHTYLLRAISFGEADTFVAFQIVDVDRNGSLTIAWKTLKDFDVPNILNQTDDELSGKLAKILSDPKYSAIEYKVLDNVVTLSGSVNRNDNSSMITAVQETKPRMINNKVTIRR